MLHKPLEEEQAEMRMRWSDPSYRWINDSNLRRQYAGRKLAAPDEVYESGHDVAQSYSGGSTETETKGA